MKITRKTDKKRIKDGIRRRGSNEIEYHGGKKVKKRTNEETRTFLHLKSENNPHHFNLHLHESMNNTFREQFLLSLGKQLFYKQGFVTMDIRF
jgi:hypothetical protein